MASCNSLQPTMLCLCKTNSLIYLLLVCSTVSPLFVLFNRFADLHTLFSSSSMVASVSENTLNRLKQGVDAQNILSVFTEMVSARLIPTDEQKDALVASNLFFVGSILRSCRCSAASFARKEFRVLEQARCKQYFALIDSCRKSSRLPDMISSLF